MDEVCWDVIEALPPLPEYQRVQSNNNTGPQVAAGEDFGREEQPQQLKQQMSFFILPWEIRLQMWKMYFSGARMTLANRRRPLEATFPGLSKLLRVSRLVRTEATKALFMFTELQCTSWCLTCIMSIPQRARWALFGNVRKVSLVGLKDYTDIALFISTFEALRQLRIDVGHFHMSLTGKPSVENWQLERAPNNFFDSFFDLDSLVRAVNRAPYLQWGYSGTRHRMNTDASEQEPSQPHSNNQPRPYTTDVSRIQDPFKYLNKHFQVPFKLRDPSFRMVINGEFWCMRPGRLDVSKWRTEQAEVGAESNSDCLVSKQASSIVYIPTRWFWEVYVPWTLEESEVEWQELDCRCRPLHPYDFAAE